MMRQLFLWASENGWLRDRLPRYRFVRRAVSRFMPGEDLGAALAATEEFRRDGMGALLTLLGENVQGEEEAAAVVRHYLDVMEAVHRRVLDAEISLKLTHLGLDLAPAVAEANLRAILTAAPSDGKVVWVDMEGSAYTQTTYELFRRVRATHANLGLCLQAYLHRTADDLASLLPFSSIRLVKGAYAEPHSITFAKKAEVDANFLQLALRLLDSAAPGDGARIGIATHDRRLIRRIADAAGARGVPRTAYEFQMLYGIQREEQRRLAAEGYRVRVLISYGSAWFPWYMRRLAERPANVWFVLRNLSRA